MPSNKGRRVASRQTQLSNRSKRKVAQPHLTEAQLRGPSPASETALAPAQSQAADGEAEHTPAAELAAPTAALSTRARRELQAIAIQAGPSLRSEVVRIGIVMFVIGGILAGLKLATDLGA